MKLKSSKYPQKLNCQKIVSIYFEEFSRVSGHRFTPKSPKEWASFCGRVNSLKHREKISWEQYYDFVKFIFSQLVPKGYYPTFGAICSSKVWWSYRGHLVRSHGRLVDPSTLGDSTEVFEKLFNILYNQGFLENVSDQ
jgi:hypothetical protein